MLYGISHSCVSCTTLGSQEPIGIFSKTVIMQCPRWSIGVVDTQGRLLNSRASGGGGEGKHLPNLLQDAYQYPPGLATEEQSGSQYRKCLLWCSNCSG